LIQPGLVILAANVHSEEPACFDLFQNDYLKILEFTMNQKGDNGCSCIYFIGRRKQSMQDILKKHEGIRIFRSFLKSWKDIDKRQAFISALSQVLSSADNTYSEMVRRIFSNV
jgi:hypothetical protein